MVEKHLIEKKIETLRQELYEAYLNKCDYEDLLLISQKLDDLLNQLNTLAKKNK